MRKPVTYLCAVALGVPALAAPLPAAAQLYQVDCAANPASLECAPSSIPQAINVMWQRKIIEKGMDATVEDHLIAAASGVLASVCNVNSVMCLLGAWAAPDLLNITRPRFGSGGGGATGHQDWTDTDCENFDWRLDIDGNLIVPTINLQGGGYLGNYWDVPSQWYPRDPSIDGGEGHLADKPDAAALYHIHRRNVAIGGDKRLWAGYWGKRNASDWIYSGGTTPFWDGSVKRNTVSFGATVRQNNFMRGEPLPCPMSGDGGGDFDFYYKWGSDTCIMYAPTPSLGKGGYAYPYTTSMPWTVARNWPDTSTTPTMLECPLHPDLLAWLAETLWAKARQADPTIPDSGPFTADDVVTGGSDPLVSDLKPPLKTASPVGEAAPITPSPTPTPSATPTPTPTPSGGPDYTDPNIGEPTFTLPDIEFPDWFELPQFSWPSPDCPIYAADFFGHQVYLAEHCVLVEDNRAVISAIMLVAFGFSAVFIVLRA